VDRAKTYEIILAGLLCGSASAIFSGRTKICAIVGYLSGFCSGFPRADIRSIGRILAPYFWLVNKPRFDAGHLRVRIIANPLIEWFSIH
jgi:hypothetical protein